MPTRPLEFRIGTFIFELFGGFQFEFGMNRRIPFSFWVVD